MSHFKASDFPDIGFVQLRHPETNRAYGPWPPLDCYVKVVLNDGEVAACYVSQGIRKGDVTNMRIGTPPLFMRVDRTLPRTHTLEEVQSWARYDPVTNKLISNGLQEQEAIAKGVQAFADQIEQDLLERVRNGVYQAPQP